MCSEKNSGLEPLETQIVVIGGGGAGLSAAVSAAENGATNIILLEKHRQLGGNSAAALDIFACESPVQKRMNVEAPKDRFFQIAMGFSHWTINPRIIRAFVNKSGDTIHWLEEKGLTFKLNQRKLKLYDQQLPLTGHTPEGTDGAGIIEALTRTAENLGVSFLKNTGAKELSIGERKKLEVLAISKTGEETRFRTDSVIIATGGYGGNKEMLRKYCPYYNKNMTLAGFPNKGDGILMAMKLGADTEGLGRLHLESKGLPREPKQLWLTSWRPETLWLNSNGERFTNEAIDNVFEAANPVARQPDCISYTVFDETIKEVLCRIMRETVMPFYLGRKREKEVARWLPPSEKIASEDDLGKLLRLAVDKGDVKISNSWDEIADWIGADVKKVKGTIDEYNTFCDKGHDDIFAKDPAHLIALKKPPFYAMKCGMRFLGTIGGIKINHRMEVLDKKGKPIPGLYAAGIDTGGWESETYNQFLMGTTFGFAINSGRISGENAVEYVFGK